MLVKTLHERINIINVKIPPKSAFRVFWLIDGILDTGFVLLERGLQSKNEVKMM